MIIHIITIFPESFSSYLNTSIIGKAKKQGLIDIKFYKLNDFSNRNQKRIDSKAYGMHGQVIEATVLSKAIKYIFKKVEKEIPIIYLSPRGELLNQEKVEYYHKKLKKEFIIICGHYEGIDQRIIDIFVDYHISIGEYIISSGELASLVFIDAITRFIPNVLGNTKSLEEDSFSKKLNRQKEYPVYTKPKVFMGLKVPQVLLSGNHKKIKTWKKNNLG